MNWQQCNFHTTADKAQALCELLEAFEPLSISLTSQEDDKLFQLTPDDNPLWQKTIVSTLWPADCDLQPMLENLQASFDEPLNIEQKTLADQDWVKLTEQSFTAKQFGNQLWVIPHWQAKDFELNPQQSKIIIEPGLAFGTGNHATTKLCLEWLATHHSQQLANKQVIDYGCGSGVLALAALALGAKQVYAIDHDPQALIATRNNAKLNTFVQQNNLATLLPEKLDNDVQADLIIANILSQPLCDLADYFFSLLKPQGTIILSGILDTEIETIQQAYRQFHFIEMTQEDEWICWVANK